ncbi:MAG: tail fiber domain-containing protein [Prevotella sp.]|nr:tail fiber domain-containing protein [Prevotella sp.]MBQ6187331.1 tail fiber domain-containing protein [Prevotella sp.]
MKTRSFFVISMIFCAICAQAQLKVDSTGVVSVGPDSLGNARLNVGNVTGYDATYQGTVNLYSQVNRYKSGLNYGIIGHSYNFSSNSSSGSIGVCGIAGGYSSGSNFALTGILQGTQNGVAVAGSTNTFYSIPTVPGRYAGFFQGNVYITGSVAATSYLNSSDRNLKENITPLCSADDEETAIDKVMDMNVVKYNYKKREIEVDENAMQLMSEDDKAALELERENAEKEAQKLHFGLIAQELQTIYPNLVTEGQDGYLAVNYVELVPVLIQSIKELKQEINEMKGEGQIAKAPTTTAIESVTAEGKTSALYQNTPNPFNGQTVIRFQIAEGAHSAYVCIFDMQGKQLQRHDLSTSDDSLTIDGTQLGAGMYLYTLIVDGKEIDTKRMILSK